jgi:hypothetical protein
VDAELAYHNPTPSSSVCFSGKEKRKDILDFEHQTTTQNAAELAVKLELAEQALYSFLDRNKGDWQTLKLVNC